MSGCVECECEDPDFYCSVCGKRVCRGCFNDHRKRINLHFTCRPKFFRIPKAIRDMEENERMQRADIAEKEGIPEYLVDWYSR